MDKMGRICPHKLSGFAFMNQFMIAGMKRKAVPVEHFVVGDTEEGVTAAIVNCVCEHGVTVEVASFPVKCGGCHRWFFFDGTAVWSLVQTP